jgi:hypothetical protein
MSLFGGAEVRARSVRRSRMRVLAARCPRYSVTGRVVGEVGTA